MSELPEATQQQPDPRGDLDSVLQVDLWRTPSTPVYEEETPAGAPAWWRGETEASDAFLKAMGLKLGPDGKPVKT